MYSRIWGSRVQANIKITHYKSIVCELLADIHPLVTLWGIEPQFQP